MLTTNRRDQRNRREALFTLESLDERLVLSATAAGAIGAAEARHEARVEARMERVEARHEARAERIEARHEARLARMEARHPAQFAATTSAPIMTAPSAATTSSQTPATTTPATTTTTTTTPSPVAVPAQPMFNVAVPATAAVSTSSMPPSTTTPAPVTNPATGSTTPTSGPLPSNVSAALQSLYSDFEAAGSGDFTVPSSLAGLVQVRGDSVEVNLKVNAGTSFGSAMAQLQSDGMQVTASSATYGLIVGLLPIGQLPIAAEVTSSVTAVPPTQAR